MHEGENKSGSHGYQDNDVNGSGYFLSSEEENYSSHAGNGKDYCHPLARTDKYSYYHGQVYGSLNSDKAIATL